MTQCEQVLRHFRAGRAITSDQAFRLFKITLVKDRCRDLRKKGYAIQSRWLTLPSGKRCKQFWL